MQKFCFWALVMLCASVASCQPPELSAGHALRFGCELPAALAATAPAAVWLKMGKRPRDAGVWVADSQSDDSPMAAPHMPNPAVDALASAPGAPAECLLILCHKCSWGVPADSHFDYAVI